MEDYNQVDSTELDSEDLQDVLEELSSISNRADKLGIALGLASGSFEPNMQSVIMTWLEQDYDTVRHGLPSYRRLVKAVASKIGARNPALANKIAANHPAGAVPQEAMETQPQVDEHNGSLSRTVEYDGLLDKWHKFRSKKFPSEPHGFAPYPMSKSPHGLCLIINNIDFEGKPDILRAGSEEDEIILRKAFTSLNYKLYQDKVHRNLAKKEMIKLLKEVADIDHSVYDSFICCLGSHGLQGVIYGSDNSPIKLDEIEKIFTTECKSLLGKPKMFFIQACRGDKLPTGRIRTDGGDEEVGIRLPQDSDVFFGYATTPGTKAGRFTKIDPGSWYFIELCKALMQHGKSKDLCSIVTAVTCEIATNNEYLVKKYKGEEVFYKQSPQIVSTLRHPVYFKSKK